jgi:hypothetical protein
MGKLYTEVRVWGERLNVGGEATCIKKNIYVSVNIAFTARTLYHCKFTYICIHKQVQ